MHLSNKTYDVLKFIAQILLPAIGALYFALSSIWGLPYATEIIGTAAAIDTFLGTLLGISSHNYEEPSDGIMRVYHTADGTTGYLLETEDVEGMANKDKIVFKVDN